ncbi:MAG: ribonuclease III [Chloroherpetonaceae bacterium]|nr:ribonuclease III [Chloroherpetonaceae bacterium]MCS7211776.1 ribonuclease III [Chloroherpetonaceae bacterium]MDW8020467.1 ribonuclease III [Chloroherpetonaceae bacterium]
MWRWKFLEKLFAHKPPAPPAASTPTDDPELAALRPRLEALTQYPIKNLNLFKVALTHRSAIDFSDRTTFVSNERLEFLGDAVLDLVAAEYLYNAYPDLDEGKLTKLRSLVVNAKTLASYARALSLGALLIISESAEMMKVRESDTALSDAFEALIGAIYLDGGYERAQAFLRTHILDKTNFDELLRKEQNYKSVLLEYAQAQRLPLPVYVVMSEDGPSHNKTFTVAVKLGEEILGQGTGKSKKEAEQRAAKEAACKLNLQAETHSVSLER